ncbi:MAG: TraI domain-containing protein, partial [Azoarcus sp.]|nr:TraI domain-containing protein [Azoarcus sp.]
MPADSASPRNEKPPSAAFHYPPADPGISALPIDALLDANKDIIERMKLAFGMNRASFEEAVTPLIERYAAYVHLLPCTADNYFEAPGGLLRLGLETAFYALQGADAHIFSGRATFSERTHLEPRWRRAAFIAGLCAELHRGFSHFLVADEDGNEWSPYLDPLSGWLRAHGVERYFLEWRTNVHETRALGLFALPHVVTTAELRNLAVGNTQIVPDMLAAITGMPGRRDHNILESLVRRALALVIHRDLLTSAGRYGAPRRGAHLARYLVDALRRLAADNIAWRPNTEKSRVWSGTDGMYLVWPGAVDDVGKLLEVDELPGIPKASETILEILLAAGFFEPREPGNALWAIYPPGAKGALDAVKLATPTALYAQNETLPEALPKALTQPSPSALAPPRPARNRESPGNPASRETLPSTNDLPAAAGTPEQLPLPIPDDNPAAAVTRAPFHGNVSPSPEAFSAKLELAAPLRLPLTLRTGLQAIVASLETDCAAAQVMDDGLFVPFAALKERRIEPPAALRALAETGMLALEKRVVR